MTVFWWIYLFAIACAFLFAYGMVEDLIRQWLRQRRTGKVKMTKSSPDTKLCKIVPIQRTWSPHGYDNHELFREDTLLRIKRLQSDANDCARRMNEIILKGNLPEKPVQLPFPEDDDAECE